ncbi:MAG: hypothetical protein V4584_00460 [Verrucomicrobiota bacterium]
MDAENRTERDPWKLELTEAQYERLEAVADDQGISVNDYIRFTMQDHAQELIEQDARLRRLGLRIVDHLKSDDYEEKGFSKSRCITGRSATNQTLQSTITKTSK